MRRLLTVLLASSLLAAACGGGDDGPSAADEREAANAAIDAFEAAARDEGFEVDPEGDDDEDDGDDALEFSDECRDLEATFDDDDDTPGQTADVDSESFLRTEGELAEENLEASLVFADADALAEELEILDDDRTVPCLEEAVRLGFEEAMAEEQDGDMQIEVEDLEVDITRPDLGDGAVHMQITGAMSVSILQIPFRFEMLAVHEGRRGATVTYSGIGSEAEADLEPFIETLLDPSSSASA